MEKTKRNAIRWSTVGALAALAALLVAVRFVNPTEHEFFPCIWRRLGIKCLTCGATRAAYSLMTFDFYSALRYHAVFTVLSPVFAYVLLALAVDLIAVKRIIPLPTKKWWIYLAVLGVILVIFGIVRNFTPYSQWELA